jgi:tetratricopeptide (TPR) repeat protein
VNRFQNVPARTKNRNLARLLSSLLAALLLASCAPRREPPPPTDQELGRLTRSARAAFDQRDASQAVRLYEQALERARALDDAAEIGNSAYNLAVSLIAAGQYERAEAMLREAQSGLDRAGENLADVLLVQARLAQLQGNHAEARHWVEQVLAAPGSNPDSGHLVQAALIRGSIAFENGDGAQARSALLEAEKTIRQTADPALRAGLEQLRGKVALLEHQPGLAAEAFDRSAGLWRKAGRYRDLARDLARAGEAYQETGRLAVGGERFLRAARSSFAQGDEALARRWLEEAALLADRAGDAWLQRRVGDFESELAVQGAGGRDDS